MAQYGIRATPKPKGQITIVEEESEEQYFVYEYEPIPISKDLTFNEKVIVGVFLAGIIAMCWRNNFPEATKSCNYCWGFCKREKRKPDPLEAEFDFKVKKKEYGFDMESSDEDEEGGMPLDVFNESGIETDVTLNKIDDELTALTFEREKLDYQNRKYGQVIMMDTPEPTFDTMKKSKVVDSSLSIDREADGGDVSLKLIEGELQQLKYESNIATAKN